jgi:hypothetical protein
MLGDLGAHTFPHDSIRTVYSLESKPQVHSAAPHCAGSVYAREDGERR